MKLRSLLCLIFGHKWRGKFEDWNIKVLEPGVVEETEVFVCSRCGKQYTLKGIIDYNRRMSSYEC